MKSIHRITATMLCLILTFALISCGKDRGKLPDGFFDERVEDTQSDTQNKENTPSADKKENPPTPDKVDDDKSKEEKENAPDKDETDEKSETDKKDDDKTIHIIETPAFSHSDEEKSVIISRYREAEGFYYDMLCQNFELDNMDTVTLESDGYETVYRRVILEDINSISELKALYGLYFTDGLVSKVDFSMYREDGGKLYCAATAGSLLSAKYDCSVESIDEDSAVVVRSAGGAVQKVKAEKVGDVWLFDGVAMR